jgi:hypothetical protein
LGEKQAKATLKGHGSLRPGGKEDLNLWSKVDLEEKVGGAMPKVCMRLKMEKRARGQRPSEWRWLQERVRVGIAIASISSTIFY